MTVLVLMPIATERGGAEQLLHRLLQHDQPTDIRWIVAFLEDGPLRRALDRQGVQTHLVEAGRLRELHRYARAVVRIKNLAEDTDSDLLLSWMPKAHLYGGWAAAWAGLPAVWYQHGAPRLNWMDQLTTVIPARSILTCSEYVADMQDNLWPHRENKVVHPCVNLARFNPEELPTPQDARRRLGLPLEGPLVGMVSRLQRWKGVHTFVEALPLVLENHPDVHGLIVGGRHELEPGYDDYIDRFIDDHEIQDRVFKVGHQSNVPMWMQAMDIVVHASDAEPFGMVIIEAMALGKPVVAGASGGPTEIITEGRDGMLAPFDQPGPLARRLTHLLNQPDEARKMGRAARERASDFSVSEFAEHLGSTLRTLTNSHPS